MAYCHRELIHAQWKIILDDEFIEAWLHGIVILCCDGIRRRFYLRIFTHSGDYPEKLVIFLMCLGSPSNPQFIEFSLPASGTSAYVHAPVVWFRCLGYITWG